MWAQHITVPNTLQWAAFGLAVSIVVALLGVVALIIGGLGVPVGAVLLAVGCFASGALVGRYVTIDQVEHQLFELALSFEIAVAEVPAIFAEQLLATRQKFQAMFRFVDSQPPAAREPLDLGSVEPVAGEHVMAFVLLLHELEDVARLTPRLSRAAQYVRRMRQHAHDIGTFLRLPLPIIQEMGSALNMYGWMESEVTPSPRMAAALEVAQTVFDIVMITPDMPQVGGLLVDIWSVSAFLERTKEEYLQKLATLVRMRDDLLQGRALLERTTTAFRQAVRITIDGLTEIKSYVPADSIATHRLNDMIALLQGFPLAQ